MRFFFTFTSRSFLIAFLLTGLSACGSRFESSHANLSSQNLPSLETPEPGSELELGICGPLDFEGILFPAAFSFSESKSLALGLSVTGSFEGHQGWNNLANNFDGQGLSLGLMQQNLGQGSLQPLLIAMGEREPGALTTLFSSSNLRSLNQMLSTWSGMSLGLSSQQKELDPELFPHQDTLSPLDEGANPFQTLGAAENNASVQWAVNNVYSGTAFKTEWKTSFTNLASRPSYRSLQVAAAVNMFRRAQDYARTFGFNELRLVLLMYDFVVQNGGFNSTHQSSYAAYVRANPQANATVRALKLLEIRLTSVKSEYREDVRRRKSTIINGTGTVHGASRNLPKEYCYTPSDKVL